MREEQDRAGAVELLMPTLQSADLWRQSGRYDAYGPEMLRIRDRHDRDMLYGPTNEEMITVIFRDAREELPRPAANPLPHPVEVPRRGPPPLRGDARPRVPDEGRLHRSTSTRPGCAAQLRARCSSPICGPSPASASPRSRCKAPTGPIGGDLSHEFLILAPIPARARSSTTPRSRTFRARSCSPPTRRPSPDLDRPLRDGGGGACQGRRLPGAGRAAAQPPRHRGRPHLRLRHQIQRQHGAERPDRGRPAGPSPDGQLRNRRVAAGGRDHRGEPRRQGHRLARGGGAVQGRA